MGRSLAGWAPLRRATTTVFSFGIGLAVAGFGAETAAEAIVTAVRALLDVNVVVLLLPVTAVFLLVQRGLQWTADVFDAKRDLFFPDWRKADGYLHPERSPTWHRTENIPERNVYELENELYGLLRRRKPLEPPLDDMLIGSGLVSIGAAAFIVAVADVPVPLIADVFLVAGGTFLGVVGFRDVKAGTRRTWR